MRRFGIIFVLSVMAGVFAINDLAEAGRKHGRRHWRRHFVHYSFWHGPRFVYPIWRSPPVVHLHHHHAHDDHVHRRVGHSHDGGEGHYVEAVCASRAPEHEGLLALLGAIGGAAVGYQIGDGGGKALAMFLGTIIGAGVGSGVGRELDEAARYRLAGATQYALESRPSGTRTIWRVSGGRACGVVVPEPAFKNERDQYCREFQQTVVVDGREESAYGTACRRPDGQWEIVN